MLVMPNMKQQTCNVACCRRLHVHHVCSLFYGCTKLTACLLSACGKRSPVAATADLSVRNLFFLCEIRPDRREQFFHQITLICAKTLGDGAMVELPPDERLFRT
ncbi:hypothetical protein BaRGS_00025800 [Batillaria attramentaria]|uniref:Uncharacterized protein n=1 Tax=Batillaria attramentaria TaxID=370345 RepID=A0ABD0K663_9CAEN